MVQARWITQDLISHRWREHPSIAGVINYYLFRFMVPLSTHNKLKDEVATLKRAKISRQSVILKLMARMKPLESKSK